MIIKITGFVLLLSLSIFLADQIQSEILDKEESVSDKVKTANIMIGNFDMPIGAVIGFVPGTSNYDLPKGFKLCNGPQIEDDKDTAFDERKIPDLNAKDLDHKKNILWIIKVN